MTQLTATLADVAAQACTLTGADPAPVAGLSTSGPRSVLPSVFDVTGLATGSVAAATVAAAAYHAARNDAPPAAVTVDSLGACAAFASEGLFTPVGWTLPPVWDPIAGNYETSDGWIRLHTNYAYHRMVVEELLGARDRDSVATAVRRWQADDLEGAVVAAGGCAAAMHDRDRWLASPPGAASAAAPPVAFTARPRAGLSGPGDRAAETEDPASQPYAGVRVLDLTRVIAGPVCTRFLAAYGADVLRLDPPGFAEVPALLPETTAGKRTAPADLASAAGRADFERLVAGADVLVSGLRADALSGLGYDDAALAAMNPRLIVASLNAYGWEGPWRDRRGFDSLVQMSSGIAAAGAAAAGVAKPAPLPVQALDHATGYLLAAAVGQALLARRADGTVRRVRASLTGTANLLWSLPRTAELGPPPAMPTREQFPLADAQTAWGPARRVPLPGRIAGVTPAWRAEAGPLGRDQPRW